MSPKQTTNLTIRVSPEEKLQWQEKAALSQVTLSSLIRQALSTSRPSQKADRSLIREQIHQIKRIGNNLNQIAKWANTYKETAEAIEVIQALKQIQESLDQLSLTPDKTSRPSQPKPPDRDEALNNEKS
jgi:two-component sensor histidine kinase